VDVYVFALKPLFGGGGRWRLLFWGERVKGGGAGKALPYPYRPALGSRKIIYKSYQEQEKYHRNGNSDQHQSISRAGKISLQW